MSLYVSVAMTTRGSNRVEVEVRPLPQVHLCVTCQHPSSEEIRVIGKNVHIH